MALPQARVVGLRPGKDGGRQITVLNRGVSGKETPVGIIRRESILWLRNALERSSA